MLSYATVDLHAFSSILVHTAVAQADHRRSDWLTPSFVGSHSIMMWTSVHMPSDDSAVVESSVRLNHAPLLVQQSALMPYVVFAGHNPDRTVESEKLGGVTESNQEILLSF